MALPWLWSRARLIIGRVFLLAGLLAWLVGTPVMLVARASRDSCASAHGPTWVVLLECGVGGPLLVAAGIALVRSRKGTRVWTVLAVVTFLCLSLAGLVTHDHDTGTG